MTARELRKLIGKKVTWEDTFCGLTCEGTVIDVKGPNILIDINGDRDWMWIPDLEDLKAKDE